MNDIHGYANVVGLKVLKAKVIQLINIFPQLKQVIS